MRLLRAKSSRNDGGAKYCSMLLNTDFGRIEFVAVRHCERSKAISHNVYQCSYEIASSEKALAMTRC
jgi:hypothetical protein